MLTTSRFYLASAGVGTALLASFTGALNAQSARPAAARTGAQIYKQDCASCHGAKGQGGKGYAKTLAGTRSVGELSRYIHKTMPPGPAKKLSQTEASAVARYIHDAFYSPIAAARNRPARIELSRLTVRQYRHAVADLIGSFRPAPKLTEQRGLKGEYFKTGQMRRNSTKILDRVDPEIRFDFGTTGPLKEQDDPYQFAMRWEGSVIPPDSGEYEIVLRTDQAARLWINDLQIPLIDAYVKSGDGNEYRSSIHFLGGRCYPLRLEFSKGVVGVNDLKKLKEKPAQKAVLALEWRRPKLALEPIPSRCLTPVVFPEGYVATTPFPPDDKSLGYERGTSISKMWEDATTQGAIETANYVLERMVDLHGVKTVERRGDSFGGNPASINFDRQPDAATPEAGAAKLRGFCRAFIERAFRRPLVPELEKLYLDRQLKDGQKPEISLKKIILLALKSPRFLYREFGSGKNDAYDAASRLSFGLWDSLPDEDLLKAAAAGELTTREQVVKQAERMASDSRAWYKLRDFLLQWLKVDQFPDLAKDPKRYPEFDERVHSDLRTSLEMFLERVVWSDKSDFRELMQTDQVFLNGRLAKIYGANLPPDAPFQYVLYQPGERAGVLTHPYLMASFAYLDSSSPIHRGVLIARNLLGRILNPPPEAFTPFPASLHPKMTTRERVAMQTRPAACMSCHDMINPLGFTLERFDAIGRLQKVENGKPVNTTGGYQTLDGKFVKFTGVQDLARFLANSEEARAAFVPKLFQYLVKQPIRAYGALAGPQLTSAFARNECSIRKQMIESVTVSALGGASGSKAASAR